MELRDGKQGFDFLGCHLHKRMSGRLWENERKRVCFLQRWPSTTSVKRVKQRVKELAPNSACHRDLRETIAKINPVLRGWGGYFATGNASAKFNQVDSYVWARLSKLMRRRKGRHLRPGEMGRWTRHAHRTTPGAVPKIAGQGFFASFLACSSASAACLATLGSLSLASFAARGVNDGSPETSTASIALSLAM